MKILRRLLILFFLLFVLSYLTIVLVVEIKGRDIVKEYFKNTSVKIDELRFRFPSGIQLRGIRIGSELAVEDVSLQFSFSGLLQKQLKVSSFKLYRPVVEFHQTKDASQRLQEAVKAVETASGLSLGAREEGTGENSLPSLKISAFSIERGELIYKNDISRRPFAIHIESINMSAHDIIVPLESSITTFDLDGRLNESVRLVGGQDLNISGWVNLKEKDMSATIQVVDEFEKVLLAANAVSEKNEMSVAGYLNLKKFQLGLNDESLEAASYNLKLPMVSSIGVEVGSAFSFNTKMDTLKIDMIDFSGKVLLQTDLSEPLAGEGLELEVNAP